MLENRYLFREESVQTSDYVINHEVGLFETRLLPALPLKVRKWKYSVQDTKRTLTIISIDESSSIATHKYKTNDIVMVTSTNTAIVSQKMTTIWSKINGTVYRNKLFLTSKAWNSVKYSVLRTSQPVTIPNAGEMYSSAESRRSRLFCHTSTCDGPDSHNVSKDPSFR